MAAVRLSLFAQLSELEVGMEEEDELGEIGKIEEIGVVAVYHKMYFPFFIKFLT
jgi:hypothetical protein